MSNSKILIIHREYRNRGGEDAFLDDILKPALAMAGLEYETLLLPPLGFSLFRASSWGNFLEIFGMFFGFEGLRPSFRTFLGVLERGGFSHVLFNNCLPTVSLKVFSAARSRGLRTFMWVHNFRLDCANGLHFDGKNICHQCLNVGSRWSFFQNCQRSWIQSLIYAYTYRGRRVAHSVVPYIDHFICNSEFTRNSLRGALTKMGLKCSSSVISMPVQVAGPDGVGSARVASMVSALPQPFYLFLGRVNYDKGADIFLDFARRFPERGFVMCGEGPMLEEVRSVCAGGRVANFALAGVVGLEEKRWLFKNCEALIVASRSPETSSLVISESQSYGTPVVYPRGGGAEETFKLLGRNGCPLDEFVGQKFVRGSSGAQALSLEDFASSLKSGLMEVR